MFLFFCDTSRSPALGRIWIKSETNYGNWSDLVSKPGMVQSLRNVDLGAATGGGGLPIRKSVLRFLLWKSFWSNIILLIGVLGIFILLKSILGIFFLLKMVIWISFRLKRVLRKIIRFIWVLWIVFLLKRVLGKFLWKTV